jgi:hypothetical protein
MGQSRQAGRSWLVFISHAGTDAWVAKQISDQIESLGARTFLDEAHIAVGQDFEEEIRAALNQADELLVLLTPWSLKRSYVWAEIGGAWVRGIPIIGILYGLTPEELHAQPGVPILLKRREMIDINQLDQYFLQLKNRII